MGVSRTSRNAPYALPEGSAGTGAESRPLLERFSPHRCPHRTQGARSLPRAPARLQPFAGRKTYGRCPLRRPNKRIFIGQNAARGALESLAPNRSCGDGGGDPTVLRGEGGELGGAIRRRCSARGRNPLSLVCAPGAEVEIWYSAVNLFSYLMRIFSVSPYLITSPHRAGFVFMRARRPPHGSLL